MENEKNVTSRYAETYTTIAKRSTTSTSQRHYNKFCAGLALIPLSTDPDGYGRLLIGPGVSAF